MQEWMTVDKMRPPRWYEHASFKRFGRNAYLNTPRIGTIGLFVAIYVVPHGFNLGITAYRDEDDDNWVVSIGLVLIEFRISAMHYFTKRKAMRRREAYLAEQGQRTILEAERYLSGEGR